MAGKVLVTISRDEEERLRLNSELKYILDNQSMRVSAKREGYRQGERKKAFEIARKMKNAERPLSEIIDFTGLSAETIERI